MSVQFRDALERIKPYVPGKSKIVHDGPVYKLSSNENPLGPSPAAMDAYKQAAQELQTYPDGNQSKLKQALSQFYADHGVRPENLIIGAGSDAIFEMVGRALLDQDSAIVMPRHGFLIHALIAREAGARVDFVPEKKFKADIDGLLAAIKAETKALFLANPGNPTGTYVNRGELKRLIDNIPPHILIILDCAYAEFVFADDYDDGLHYGVERENILVTRTFSKIYGLAALRLGYGIAHPHIIDRLNRVRMPFNVTSGAIEAGVAALSDQEHVVASADFNRTALTRLMQTSQELGLEIVPSATNFMLLHCGGERGEKAAEICQLFEKKGLIIRPVAAYGLPNHIRIGVGSEAANQLVLNSLSEVKAALA